MIDIHLYAGFIVANKMRTYAFQKKTCIIEIETDMMTSLI